MKFLWQIVIWLSAALISFSIWQSTSLRLKAKNQYARVLEIEPEFPEALIQQNQALLKVTEDRRIDQIRKNASAILRQEPLSDDALLHFALTEIGQLGQSTRQDLLEMAKGRNARNRLTTLSLLTAKLADEDFEGVTKELDLIYRLNSDNIGGYIQLLDGLSLYPGAQAAIFERLKTNPKWGYRYLQSRLNKGNIDEVLQLRDSVSQFNAQASDTRERDSISRLLLLKLVQANEIDLAYNWWRNTYEIGDDNRLGNQLLFNRNLQNLDIQPPFNWRLIEKMEIRASLEPQGGVFLSYNGSKPELAMRQIFPMRAGLAYELKVLGNVTYSGKRGHYQWRLTCAGTRTLLGIADMKEKNSREFKSYFVRPPENVDCKYGDLTLWAMPGVYRSRISLLLEDVSVTPVDQ